MVGAALALVLTAAQVRNINYVMKEAPDGLAIRSAAIFLVESSAGEPKFHTDPKSHGWFQLKLSTACLMEGFGGRRLQKCPITEKQLETDSHLNTKLGLAYIEYCHKAFPASEARQIICYRWGEYLTQAMPQSKVNKLSQPGGYVWRVLNCEKQLLIYETPK